MLKMLKFLKSDEKCWKCWNENEKFFRYLLITRYADLEIKLTLQMLKSTSAPSLVINVLVYYC